MLYLFRCGSISSIRVWLSFTGKFANLRKLAKVHLGRLKRLERLWWLERLWRLERLDRLGKLGWLGILGRLGFLSFMDPMSLAHYCISRDFWLIMVL